MHARHAVRVGAAERGAKGGVLSDQGNGASPSRQGEVGDLEFTYEGLDLPGSPGWVLFVWTTVPGSPSEERVKLLGSLAVTRSASSTAADPEG